MILNINCPINTTSYGYVSANFIKELKNLNYDLRHIAISGNDPDEEIAPYIQDVLSRWDFSYDAPCLKIWHQFDLGAFYGKGVRIGFPIFELERFNNRELHSLNNPDEIFVCSDWAKQVIENNVPEKAGHTHVVPLGYDPNIFKPCPLPESDDTIFGNFGKFEVRNGHDVLVDIFNKAFEPKDNVLLVMMPSNSFMTKEETEEWVKKYKTSKMGDKIVLVGRQKTHSMVYNIMSQIHCGIFPSRAEGWNLEALELLGCGRHVIITHATAHTEFCNTENCRLVHMGSGYEPAYDGKWFHGQFEWRKIGSSEIDQMVEHMRTIHKKRLEGQLALNISGLESAKNYTWKSVAKILDSKIRKVST
jgi:glycosyltransferase involved in cell wall biosynthesis